MAGTEPVPPEARDVESIPPALMQLSIDTRKSTRSSEPTTPGDSPLSLDSTLRDWLSETLKETSNSPKVYIKLLVSNGAAGSIIGKGGTNINDCQMKTFARIQLSKSQEYFPGTQERTLLISGRMKNVIAALSMLLDKLVRENVAPLSPRTRSGARPPSPEPRLQLKVLVPQALCGIIIGKMGSTIRGFAADTGTNIRVVQEDHLGFPLANRIVTVAGTVPGILRAVALLVLKQSEDTTYSLFSDLSSTYATSPASVLPGAAYLAGYVGMGPAPYAPATAPPRRLGGWAGAAPVHATQSVQRPAGSPVESVASVVGGDSALSGPGSSTPDVDPGAGGGPGSGSAHGSGASTRAPSPPRAHIQVLIHRDQAAMLSDSGYALANHLGRLSGAWLRLEPRPQPLPGLGLKGRLLTVSGPAHAVHHMLALLTSHVGQLLPVGAGPMNAWAPGPSGFPAGPAGLPLSPPGYCYAPQSPQPAYMPIATTIAGCTYYSLPGAGPHLGPAPGHVQSWPQPPRRGGSDAEGDTVLSTNRAQPDASPALDEPEVGGSGSQVTTPCSGASSTRGVDDVGEPGPQPPRHLSPPLAVTAAT